MKKNTRFFKLVLVFISAAFTACSSTNPYQRSAFVDIPVRQLAISALRSEIAPSEEFAGDLHGAVMALKDQRREWYEALSTQAQVRAVSQFALLGLSTAALYSGLKSGVSSDGDKKRLALAGAVGFTAFAGSDWFINPYHEDAYLEGIKGITCSLSTIEPYRVGIQSFRVMQFEQFMLRNAVNDLDAAVLQAEAIYRYPRDSEIPAAKVRVEAITALSQARKTLISSEQLYTQLDNSGVILMREGDLVFSSVAKRIAAGNKQVTTLDVVAKQGAGIIGSFRAVEIDRANEGSKAGKPPEVINSAPPNSVSSGSVSSPVAIDSKLLTTASAKDLLTQLSERMRQDLEAGLKHQTEKIELERNRKAADVSAKKDELLSIDKLTNSCNSVSGQDCANWSATSTALRLAKLTSDLYAARRPLSQRLLTFNKATDTAARNPNCGAVQSAMSLSPATDAKVKPGQTYDITVSGVPVAPTVKFDGMVVKVDRLLGSSSMQYIVRINLAPNAKGVIMIWISDRDLATEEITLTVDEAAAK